MSAAPTVVIAVPVYRLPLTAAEEIAWRHLERHLPGYERVGVVPDHLVATGAAGRALPFGLAAETFDRSFFASTADYSRLLLSRAFYERFSRHDYVLVYQLDCLVFADHLADWCRSGWDYVGAPWLRDLARPERGFSRVGNGGFSLRRVESFRRVLDAPAPRRGLLLRVILGASLPDLPRWALRARARVASAARVGALRYAASYTLNEDRFWSDRARLFDPRFRIPPPQQALGFSFEQAPRYCFARNGNRLPMGCHAWQKWDHAFWQPHLGH